MKIKIEVDISDLLENAAEDEISLPETIRYSIISQVTSQVMARLKIDKISNEWQDTFKKHMDEKIEELAKFPESYASNQVSASINKHLGAMIKGDVTNLLTKTLARDKDFILAVAQHVFSNIQTKS